MELHNSQKMEKLHSYFLWFPDLVPPFLKALSHFLRTMSLVGLSRKCHCDGHLKMTVTVTDNVHRGLLERLVYVGEKDEVLGSMRQVDQLGSMPIVPT